MSNENISVGDLVMVVKSSFCCNDDAQNGRIFLVKEISSEYCTCGSCGKTSVGIRALRDEGVGYLLERLVRIKPLSELTSTEIKEEIPA